MAFSLKKRVKQILTMYNENIAVTTNRITSSQELLHYQFVEVLNETDFCHDLAHHERCYQ